MLSISTFSICSLAAYASNDSELEEGYEYAVEFLESLYENAYMFEENDLSQYTDSESFLAYLEGYVDIRRLISTRFAGYSTEYELLDCVTSGNYLYYEILHTSTIEYEGSNQTVGKSTRPAYVIIEKTSDGYVVKDWILPAQAESYIGYIRGFDLNSLIEPELSDPCYWDNRQKDAELLDTIDSIIQTQVERIERESGASEDITVNDPEEAATVNSELVIIPRRVFPLDRSAIVNWAESNYDKDTPTTGNSAIVPQYYDFSEITGNFDCTNFASHALLAGGAIVYDTGDPGTGWYYNSLSDRSYSWSGVPNFGSFLINNRTKGPGGYAMEYTNIQNNDFVYQEGDIIQYYINGRWNHTAIVTGFEDVGNNELGALVTYRSSDTIRDVNASQDYYGAEATRIIRLYGYYPGDSLN